MTAPEPRQMTPEEAAIWNAPFPMPAYEPVPKQLTGAERAANQYTRQVLKRVQRVRDVADRLERLSTFSMYGHVQRTQEFITEITDLVNAMALGELVSWAVEADAAAEEGTPPIKSEDPKPGDRVRIPNGDVYTIDSRAYSENGSGEWVLLNPHYEKVIPGD